MEAGNRLEHLTYRGTLEEFLSSLYNVILKYESKPLTGKLLVEILDQAWTATPSQVTFNRRYNAPPDEITAQDQFRYLQQMLLYQIQDLQRIREAGMLDGIKDMSGPIISPTNNSWYNWSVNHFVSVLEPYADSFDSDYTWKEVADYLYEAQIYE